MRRWLTWGVVLAVGAALWWWKHPRTDGPPGHPSGWVSPESAKRRALHALLNVPLPPARGTLRIAGQVVGQKGALPGAVVVATGVVPKETLSELPCECDPPEDSPLL